MNITCTQKRGDNIKIERLISIITILLQNEKVTAPYLAEKFEVSRRTINRDIEDMCKAGIPIVTTQGFDGGISIADGYKINKTLFTVEELKAIFTGLKTIDSVSDISYTNQVITKLSENDNAIISTTSPIVIDLASHYRTSLAEKIKILKSAIYENRCVSFVYYYNKGEVKRTVEPYLLVFKWSSWYLLCYCLDKCDFRFFKLNRLWELDCLSQTFLPKEISEDILKNDSFFTEEIQLIAKFDVSMKYRLIEEYGIDSFEVDESEKLLFKSGFTSKEHLMSWVLSFGKCVEVLEPKELRLKLREHALEILEKYKET